MNCFDTSHKIDGKIWKIVSTHIDLVYVRYGKILFPSLEIDKEKPKSTAVF